MPCPIRSQRGTTGVPLTCGTTVSVDTLDGIRTYVQDVVENIGSDFTDPDDDWMQVACIEGEKGMIVLVLPNSLFENGYQKDALAYTLRQAMRHFGAYRYAVLFNAHMKAFASEEEMQKVRDEERRISELDGAREMLLLVVGDAEQENAFSAEIKRDGVNPPTLEEWKGVDGMTGRFSGLNEAMSALDE